VLDFNLGSVLEAFWNRRRIDDWSKLIYMQVFSGVTSFLTMCGGALSAHRPTWEAVGVGMVSAAVGMTIIFRRSQLTKGMTVALPAKEAEAELDANEQVIAKP
jgi:hypothetical protein